MYNANLLIVSIIYYVRCPFICSLAMQVEYTYIHTFAYRQNCVSKGDDGDCKILYITMAAAAILTSTVVMVNHVIKPNDASFVEELSAK